ncbi:DUF6449 domain-containing protein [Paraliobacillus salinarum]|uniref:DUF6449 domain-containing protein n=1 Tax=Paraliobacillus salinarum TaxID=1158996 RepID=UPI0015F38B4F|nr:DUF6449 domain-containing protein [Paraliobacillus salinarum]
MQSKTSWFKKELVKQDFRQVGWISLVYTVILFIVMPLNIAMYLSQDNMYTYITDNTYNNLFEFAPPIQLLTIFVAPVILAIALFRYMQVNHSADYMHSLPMKRQTIFYHKFGLGMFLLVATDLFISLVLVVISFTFDVSHFYTFSDIGIWFSLRLLLQSLVFSITVFVGMLTGLSTIQGIFTYIFMFFPVGITMLIMFNLDQILIGFPTNYLLEDQIYRYSPITYSWELLYEMNGTIVDIMSYILFTLFFTGISLWLYTKRRTEAASQTVAFAPLRPIFKYSFTFCMTLVGGSYFGGLQNQYGWLIFGYVFGSIIGYVIAQMILKKTWRVFSDWKSYFYYVLACSILFVLISLDITGYESRVPNLDDIEQVYLMEQETVNWQEGANDEQYEGIKSQSLINEVRDIHQKLIASSERSNLDRYYSNTIELKYDLKSGRQVVRKYNVPDTVSLDEQLKPIYESKAYKKMNYPILSIDQSKIKEIEIFQHINSFETVYIGSNDKRIESLIQALQQDVINRTFDDIRYPTNSFVDVMVHLKNNDTAINIRVQPTDAFFMNWLKNEGLYDEVMVTTDQVDAIYLKEFNRNSHDLYNDKSYLNNKDAIKITNDKEISELLHSISQRGAYEQERVYGIAIDIKGVNHMIVELLEPTKLPDFVSKKMD